MAKIKNARRAYLRGAAQAFDVKGVIGTRRLQSIRDKSVSQALGSDWARVTQQLDQCVVKWTRRVSEDG